VLRRIFGAKRNEETGEWRKLHKEEFNNLQSSPNIVRVIKSVRMRQEGYEARIGERKGVYRILVGKYEEKSPLGRSKRRWEDKIYLQEVECGVMEWIELALDRDRWRGRVNAVMNLRVP